MIFCCFCQSLSLFVILLFCFSLLFSYHFNPFSSPPITFSTASRLTSHYFIFTSEFIIRAIAFIINRRRLSRNNLKKIRFLILIIALIKIYPRLAYYKRRLICFMIFRLSKIVREMATMANFPKSPHLSDFEMFLQVNFVMF